MTDNVTQVIVNGGSAPDKKMIDVHVEIKVWLGNQQLNQNELDEQGLLQFCNNKRAQNTTLIQIFNEFAAIILNAQQFDEYNFTEINAKNNSIPEKKTHQYQDVQAYKLEDLFKDFNSVGLKEVVIYANLFD